MRYPRKKDNIDNFVKSAELQRAPQQNLVNKYLIYKKDSSSILTCYNITRIINSSNIDQL